MATPISRQLQRRQANSERGQSSSRSLRRRRKPEEMEAVEVMKANNRQQAGANWPMDCICNLCSCGNHSCASFALNGAATAANNNNNNRCRGAAAADQDTDRRSEASGDSCHHLTSERYLTGKAPSPGAPRRSPTKGGKKKSAPDERAAEEEALVHVMVTRPEIASKPRDNILFEGDMDLRTTFETSYEALAKMRLDQWKKYQEVAKTTGARQAATKSRKHRSPIVADEEEEEEERGDFGGEARDEEDVSKSLNRSHRKVKPREEWTGAKMTSQPATPSRSRTPFAVAHDSTNNNNNNNNSQQNDHDETDWDYHYNLDRSSRQPRVQQQQPQSPSPRKTPEVPPTNADGHRAQESTVAASAEKSAPGGYVDPDLASIIVYDANMNRLERVGMRKRSKYRPSTSLRSGARGLFGDQEILPEEKPPADGRTSRGEDKAMQTEYAGGIIGPAQETPAAAAAPSHGRGSISMRARNLKNSTQTPDRLVYSERNVPVNTKRRLADNVNMRDHLREQHIVDGGSPQMNSRQQLEREVKELEAAVVEQAREEEENRLALEREMADIKLAEQEEAAANAEIQRVAGLDPTAAATRSSAHLNQTKSVSGGGGGTETRTSSRQSRLQRTCQEQSFHIGQNDYPIEPVAPPAAVEKFSPTTPEAKATKSSAMLHASPQSRVYNNLFSESPDFILTTGKSSSLNNAAIASAADAGDRAKLHRGSTREDNKQPYRDVAGEDSGHRYNDYQLGATPAAMTSSASDATFAQQHPLCELCHEIHHNPGGCTAAGARSSECRVVKLGEQFQYVGSRSGHKFFVEKILDPE